MIYPKTKLEIINLILIETKDDPDFPWNNIPADKIISEWFITGRTGNGLRLTDAGMTAFNKASIAHYDFEFTPPKNAINSSSWGKYTLAIDKKVKCPYYVGVKQDSITQKKQPYIRLYDNKIAMMMALYGDFQSYLDSVK
jgi:hypothetical protein